MIVNDDKKMKIKGKEKKEARKILTQYKEGKRNSHHKFSKANNDIDITHSIWWLTLNLSFLSLYTTYALLIIILHFIISY